MSDVVRPLKKLLPAYKAYEAGVMNAVADAFGLTRGVFDHSAVKEADSRLLENEQVTIRNRPRKRPMDARYVPPFDMEAMGLSFRCALPSEARQMFLARYAEIVGGGGTRIGHDTRTPPQAAVLAQQGGAK